MVERFRFVPFGQRAGGEAVACDGLVDGAGTHLSHWGGNRTEARYKADTSVEIALRYVASEDGAPDRARPVTNNHFDTDGVLAVWVLLEPSRARACAGLITAAADGPITVAASPAAEAGPWLAAAVTSAAFIASAEAKRCAASRASALLMNPTSEAGASGRCFDSGSASP